MRGAAPRAAHFLLRGQEKVSKEKAARGLAATRYPALLSISGVRELARQKASRSNTPHLTLKCLRCSASSSGRNPLRCSLSEGHARGFPPNSAVEGGTARRVARRRRAFQARCACPILFPTKSSCRHKTHSPGANGDSDSWPVGRSPGTDFAVYLARGGEIPAFNPRRGSDTSIPISVTLLNLRRTIRKE